jgi:hypothetical protein
MAGSVARGSSGRRRSRLPVCEALERRGLLAGGLNAFATIPIPAPANPGQTSAVTFQINPGQFTTSARKSFWIKIDDSTAQGPGPTLGAVTTTVPTRGGLVPRVAQTIPLPGNQELVKVGYGTFTLAVGPIGLATPPATVRFSLAGDATGAFAVGPASLGSIRASLGQRAGSPSYNPAADVNDDGVINRADLRLAQTNLGAGTTVRPLGVTVDTTVSGSTLPVSRTITIRTNPGASVKLGVVGTDAVLSGTAGADGSDAIDAASLTKGLDSFVLDVQANDAFGQYVHGRNTIPNALGEGYGFLADGQPAPNPDLAPPASEWQKPLPQAVNLVADTANVPPIYDQGTTSSCTANAFAWDYWFTELKQGLPVINVPSRAFIYYNSRVASGQNPVIDDGSTNFAAILSMVNTGVAPEGTWPFGATTINATPPASAYAAAQAHKVLAYYQLDTSNLAQLEGSLAAGYPFVVGVRITSTFSTTATELTGQIPMPQYGAPDVGGHAIVIVGYDNSKQEFIFANSWGRDWGVGGYGYIPFSYVTSTLASGAYSIRSVS